MRATTLKELINQLQSAEIIPRPDNETGEVLMHRLSTPAVIAAIDEETYFHFLDVLPPKCQLGGLFAFAEGAEALRLFWLKDNQFFCRQLTWDETKDFCRLASISFPYWY